MRSNIPLIAINPRVAEVAQNEKSVVTVDEQGKKEKMRGDIFRRALPSFIGSRSCGAI